MLTCLYVEAFKQTHRHVTSNMPLQSSHPFFTVLALLMKPTPKVKMTAIMITMTITFDNNINDNNDDINDMD